MSTLEISGAENIPKLVLRALMTPFGKVMSIQEAPGRVHITFADAASAATCLQMTQGRIVAKGATLVLREGSSAPMPVTSSIPQPAPAPAPREETPHSAPKRMEPREEELVSKRPRPDLRNETEDMTTPRGNTDDKGQRSDTACLLVLCRRGVVPGGSQVKVTPYILYQMLRGEAFPMKIQLLRPKSEQQALHQQQQQLQEGGPAPAPVVINEYPATVRALVQMDSAASLQRVQENLHTSWIELYQQERFQIFVSPHEGDIYAQSNNASALVVLPEGVQRLGAPLTRRWVDFGEDGDAGAPPPMPTAQHALPAHQSFQPLHVAAPQAGHPVPLTQLDGAPLPTIRVGYSPQQNSFRS